MVGGFWRRSKDAQVVDLATWGRIRSARGKVNVKILDGSFEMPRSHPTWDGPKTVVNTNGCGDKNYEPQQVNTGFPAESMLKV